MNEYTVVITGESGSAYGMRLIEQLLDGGHSVALVVTPAGNQQMEHEIGFAVPDRAPERAVRKFLEIEGEAALRVVGASDLLDPIASRTRVADAAIAIPASMGFVGAVASGLTSDVAERAANVQLREGRKLVLVPRETPLSLVYLRNLTTLAEAGATILPAMPAFDYGPETLDDQVNYVVGKVLDVLGLDHDLFKRAAE